jgi:glycosyltransferase involved in cell wall biosynthesis
VEKKREKILLLSSGDVHGAYELIYQIAKCLKEAKYEVALLVRSKTKSDSFILHIDIPHQKKRIISRINNRVHKLFGRSLNNPIIDPSYVFLPNEDERKQFISANKIINKLTFIPDLILVGMIDGFINTSTLAELKRKTNARIFLIMVDMFQLTGGCHFVRDCKGFENDCSECPAILNDTYKSWPHENLTLKMANIQKAGIQVLAASGWTLEQVKKSYLFGNQKNIYNINSCIDTRIFNNKNRGYAKSIFDFRLDSKVIFFGSKILNNEHKGMKYLIEALIHLNGTIDNHLKSKIYIMIIGNDSAENELTIQIPFKKIFIDYIRDYRLLSLAYQASNIFVCPSVEDGGPLMVSEALACGTPVVGFKMGVLYNLVKTDYNGYVAEMKNSKDLAFGINKILSLNEVEFCSYSQNAISIIKNYSSQEAAVNIINQILADQTT